MLVALGLLVVAGSPAAFAAQPAVGLGTATPFAVLAGTTVTNTGPTVVSGNLGVSPGSAVTGFPPGKVIKGAKHVADAKALQAQNDLVTAYDDAAGRTPATTVTKDLGGKILAPGVYRTAKAMSLTGTVTLDAAGDPDAVFIFQAGSTLITAGSSTVALVNGADPCNVFWQVGSSATLRTDTTFVGTIMALTTATLKTRATVVGRVLARNGAVNLDTNTITQPNCAARAGGPSPTPSRLSSTSGVPGDLFVDLLEPRDELLDPGVVGQDGRRARELSAEQVAQHGIEEEHRVRAQWPVGPAGLEEVDGRRREAAELDLAGDLLDQLVTLLVGGLERQAHRARPTASAVVAVASRVATDGAARATPNAA